MFKFNLIPAFILVCVILALANPIPQETTNPLEHITQRLFVGSSPQWVYELRIPIINQFLNVQELGCYECYKTTEGQCSSNASKECQFYHFTIASYVGGLGCIIFTNLGLSYRLPVSSKVEHTYPMNGTELRLICCGEKCHNNSTLGSPPAWYLQSLTKLPPSWTINDQPFNYPNTLEDNGFKPASLSKLMA